MAAVASQKSRILDVVTSDIFAQRLNTVQLLGRFASVQKLARYVRFYTLLCKITAYFSTVD